MTDPYEAERYPPRFRAYLEKYCGLKPDGIYDGGDGCERYVAIIDYYPNTAYPEDYPPEMVSSSTKRDFVRAIRLSLAEHPNNTEAEVLVAWDRRKDKEIEVETRVVWENAFTVRLSPRLKD